MTPPVTELADAMRWEKSNQLTASAYHPTIGTINHALSLALQRRVRNPYRKDPGDAHGHPGLRGLQPQLDAGWTDGGRGDGGTPDDCGHDSGEMAGQGLVSDGSNREVTLLVSVLAFRLATSVEYPTCGPFIFDGSIPSSRSLSFLLVVGRSCFETVHCHACLG